MSLEDSTFLALARSLQLDSVALKAAKFRAPQNNQFVTSEEVKAIQASIQKTCRPSWQQAPPRAFGTSQQGKLKADQWRTLIEFDIPVSLVELWVDVNGSCADKKHLALIEITMNLATAVFYGTSRRTSENHAALYTMHLQKYLKGLQMLSPAPKLVPNHHFALHVGEQLLLFGPVSGWWTYPYERLIGRLQRMRTSYRVGMSY